MLTKRINGLLAAFFIAIVAILCFSLFGCAGSNKGENENDESGNTTDYSLNSFVCSVEGMEDVYVDINDMSTSDHATYDTIIMLYGKTVRISDNKIRFVDGTSFMALGEMDYTLNGDKMTVANESVTMIFNDIRLKDGVFSFGLTTGGVSYGFDYYSPDATAPEFTVSFNMAGGSGTIASNTVKKGQPVSKPSNPSRTGYRFDGWYTDDKYTTAWDFTKGKVISDITLYAKWVRTYKLTFDAAGGTCTTGSITVEKGKKIGALPTPKFGKLEFDGWYDSKLNGYKWTADTVFNGSSDKVLYAHWITTLTLDCDGLGGVGALVKKTETLTVQYGKSIGILDKASDTSTNAEFAGWYTDHSADGKKVNDNETFLFEEPTTFYAAWNIPLKLNAEGGAVSQDIKNFIFGKPIGELPTPENGEKVFGGWFSNTAGRGNEYTADKVLNADDLPFWSALTAYAKWSYKVKFDYQGATSGDEVADMNIVYKDTIDYKFYDATPSPYKEGWSFEGWFMKPNGEGCKLTRNNGLLIEKPFEHYSTWSFKDEITLYAYWVKGTDKRKFNYTIQKHGFTMDQEVIITGLRDKTLTEIEIPAVIAGIRGYIYIEAYAFADTNLTKVDFSNVGYSTGQELFKGCLYGCPLTELKTGYNLHSDHWNNFFRNRGDTETVIPSPITVNGKLYGDTATTSE